MLASGNHELEHRVPFFAIAPVPDPQGVQAESKQNRPAVPS
jgi:hypothetical protein